MSNKIWNYIQLSQKKANPWKEISGGETKIVFPVENKTFQDIGDPFGNRMLNGKPNFHPGIDIPATQGTAALAATRGIVTFAGNRNDGYGNCVEITVTMSNGDKIMMRYAHLEKINVTKGQYLGAGEKIGEVGSTGYSFGSHLHFETHINGKRENPINLWSNYQTIYPSSSLNTQSTLFWNGCIHP